ncbi:DUF1353 domain-containing protein [Roseovarius sp. EL26]|uniref:DUF1353 domain-containing protein n=1 Tax=Roseovarius sp. EL26 TaxID=2126672 RepID=UPI000EA12A0D|nr:DUF1353 domain-containing protein [Roseovarius sp. EL26]
MRLSVLPIILSGSLAGCAPGVISDDAEALAVSRGACGENGGAACAFNNSPVQLDRSKPLQIQSRVNTFYRVAEPLQFVDGEGVSWVADSGTVTDGASIPDIFVPIVGSPTTKEFVNAAAIHDAYCGIGNENGQRFHSNSWQRVHVMFYNALRAGGTSSIKAKIMFAAVYLGGPRWGEPYRRPSENASTSEMQEVMVLAKEYIEVKNPNLDDLIWWLDRAEGGFATAAGSGDQGGSGGRGGDGGGEGGDRGGRGSSSSGASSASGGGASGAGSSGGGDGSSGGGDGSSGGGDGSSGGGDGSSGGGDGSSGGGDGSSGGGDGSSGGGDGSSGGGDGSSGGGDGSSGGGDGSSGGGDGSSGGGDGSSGGGDGSSGGGGGSSGGGDPNGG